MPRKITNKVPEPDIEEFVANPYALVEHLAGEVTAMLYNSRSGIANALMKQLFGVWTNDWHRFEMVDGSVLLKLVKERVDVDKLSQEIIKKAESKLIELLSKNEDLIIDSAANKVYNHITWTIEKGLEEAIQSRYQTLIANEVEARIQKAFLTWEAFNKLHSGAATPQD
jgi:hypothetical protein